MGADVSILLTYPQEVLMHSQGWEQVTCRREGQDTGTTEKQAVNPEGVLSLTFHTFCNKSKVGGAGEEQKNLQWFWKCVLQTSSISWELVRNSDSWAPFSIPWPRHLCFDRTSRGFWCMLQFENYRIRIKRILETGQSNMTHGPCLDLIQRNQML